MACLASVADAGNYGPTDATRDLQAIIASEPAIGEALADSLGKAGYNGITTLEDFYDYVDRTVRLVPTNHSLLEEVRPFFHLVGQSGELRSNTLFLDWVKRYVASYGRFLDTTASAAGLETFYDDPAFRVDDYVVGPSGWLTFNQFFAREIKPGKRPIAGLGDGATIVSPSDGTVRGLYPVDAEAKIAVKGIGYSIAELLQGSRYADAFAGGQFMHSYQGVTDYHRLHVPFSGRIVEKKNVAGYVWLDLEHMDDGSFVSVDETGFQWRQERGIIVLETENIGLVAILPVGMGLVGGVVLTPDEGAELHKGEEFGFFQFGGSDVIMVFQKDRVEITAETGQRYLQGQALGMARESGN
jgi:phosphatidylserine decarboxylase precursor